MVVRLGKLWAVESGPGALAAVRARDAAEELTRRRSAYFQCNLPEPLEVLVACATAWAAVAVAECAAAAEEREQSSWESVEVAPPGDRFEWWTVERATAENADALAAWARARFGSEEVEIVASRDSDGIAGAVELRVRRAG